MTEENENIPSELETLKQRADMMGIKYHPSIGLEKLKEKVNGQLETSEEPKPENKKVTPMKDGGFIQELSEQEYAALQAVNHRKNAASLVRIRIACMNPNKKEWEGEIFSVGSAKLGTFKKFVPYNTEWHVPQIMLNMIKERQCAIFHTVTGPRGMKMRKARLVPEFNVEILPPLTMDELKDLRKQQALAESTD